MRTGALELAGARLAGLAAMAAATGACVNWRAGCQTSREATRDSCRDSRDRPRGEACEVAQAAPGQAPTELDVYASERWVDDALFRPEVREAYRRLVAQGWVDALRALHAGERVYTFWKYLRNAFERDASLRIDHLLRPRPRLVFLLHFQLLTASAQTHRGSRMQCKTRAYKTTLLRFSLQGLLMTFGRTLPVPAPSLLLFTVFRPPTSEGCAWSIHRFILDHRAISV